LGTSSVLHCDAQMHFKMFKLIGSKHVIARCEGIWVGIIGEIWNYRNMVIFKNGCIDLVEVFTVVQRKTWSWIMVKEKVVGFSYSD